jgi:hypothetical protein
MAPAGGIEKAEEGPGPTRSLDGFSRYLDYFAPLVARALHLGVTE